MHNGKDRNMNLSLVEVVDKIIGRYTSCGSSEKDSESMDHLYAVEGLLNHIVDKLYENVVDGRNSFEGSVQAVGKRSHEILKDIAETIDYLKNE
jgi:hypothetical protein